MNNRSFRHLIFLALVAGIIGATAAQELTATPAPSKTPTLIPETTAEPIERVAVTVEARPLSRAFTQEDLQVLVGNVQRPNGIAWWNDNLYVACNGDWTLYEINSVTGSTITLIFGIQDAFTLHAEESPTGYNLFVPDFEKGQIFRVDERRAAPELIAENLSGPWGIAALGDSFFVTTLRSGELLQVSRVGEVTTVVDGLRSPTGVAVDGEFVYVANNGSARRAIEWFEAQDLEQLELRTLVTGIQNPSSLVLGADGYLYFTYALGTRGVVGRVQPETCRNQECSQSDVEIVLFSELQAPLAGLTISPDMRLFVHTIYRPEIYWVKLYE